MFLYDIFSCALILSIKNNICWAFTIDSQHFPTSFLHFKYNVPFFAILHFQSCRGACGLWLDESLYHGRSQPCATFKNKALTRDGDFVIKYLETWTFVWATTHIISIYNSYNIISITYWFINFAYNITSIFIHII